MKSNLPKYASNLTPFLLNFKDKGTELLYNKEMKKNRKLSLYFSLISFCYGFFSVILGLTVKHNPEDTFTETDSYCLLGVSFVLTVFNFCCPKNNKILNSILYVLYIVLSCTIIQVTDQIKSIYDLNSTPSEILWVKTRFDFIAMQSDFCLKLIWVLSPLNNFPFLFITNSLNIFISLFIFLKHDKTSKESFTLFFCFYVLELIIVILISYYISKLKKNLFYERSLLNGKEIRDNMNSGYIKFRGDKILEMNDYFEKEKYFLIKEDRDDETVDFRKQKDLTPEESRHIIFLILSNFISFNEILKINNTLLQSPISLHNRPESQLIRETMKDLTRMEMTDAHLDFEILNERTLDKDSYYREVVEKGDFSYLVDFIIYNKDKFKTFTNFGKSVIAKGQEEVLSYESLVKVNGLDNSVEIIFNDVTKQDTQTSLKQFVINSGQFLHDFKNPLICINEEISEMKDFNEKMINHVYGDKKEYKSITLHECLSFIDKYDYIKKMSEYCQTMIATYEDLSRSLFKAKKITISEMDFDLLSLLEFINNMMQYKLSHSNKNVEFILDQKDFKDEKSLVISNDENKLKQVLINLLSNAEKFTPKGSIRLTANRENIDNKKYIKLTIEDSGIGIDASSVEKIFNPFFSKNSEACNRNGCGLGLLIVKEITEKMGIGIKIRSELDKGTTTWFYIEEKRSSKYHSNIELVSMPEENELDINDIIMNDENEIFHLSGRENEDNANAANFIIIKRHNKRRSCQYPVSGIPLYPRKLLASNKSLNISKISNEELENILPIRNKSCRSTQKSNIGMMNIFNNYYSNSKFNYLKIANECSLEILGGKYQSNKKQSVFSSNFDQSLFSNCNGNKVSKTYYKKNSNFTQMNTGIPSISVIASPTTTALNNRLPSMKLFTDFAKKQLTTDNNMSMEISKRSSEVNSDYYFNKILNILIIDNETSIRSATKKVIKKICDSEKIQTIFEEADDGVTGLCNLYNKYINSNENYDLILLDDIMPMMDGTDMYKLMSYVIENKLIKVKADENILDKIVICSSASDYVKNKLKNFKGMRVCEKPLTTDIVKNLIGLYF